METICRLDMTLGCHGGVDFGQGVTSIFSICDHVCISKDELTLEAEMSHLYEHLCR